MRDVIDQLWLDHRSSGNLEPNKCLHERLSRRFGLTRARDALIEVTSHNSAPLRTLEQQTEGLKGEQRRNPR